MRKKIFRAFLALSLGLLVAFTAAAVIIHQLLKTQDELKHLQNFGSIIANAVERHGYKFLSNIDTENVRISVIDDTGIVLYDSVADENKMENHQDRVEVQDALRHGESSTRRYSDTLNQETFYHALRLNNGLILRLSFTSDSLFAYTQPFTFLMELMLLLLIALCYYIATTLSSALIEPINELNLNDLRSISDPFQHAYEELHPFLWRIVVQQRKIDEQIDELRLKNSEFQTITKSMSDGLVVLNAQGKIVSINKTARKIFAVTKENCLNQSYQAIDNSQYMHDMMQNSATKPKQTMHIVRDGRDFELRFSKIVDSDNKGICIGYALIILDVTEKKRTEQMRQEFTANVSHELKTPLQSIIGYSEMMASGFVKEEDIKHFATRIHKQSSRLKTLIEDIIFLSHLDEGQVSGFDEVSVKSICQEVFENLQEKALERLVRLSVRGNDLKFYAVNRYLYELIYNLVDNAIRYNKENGRITITLSETNNKYLIEVKDTGIGLAPEDQFRIFERFYRVDKSHSRQTGGTGLGLSIVKRVVLYHQGKIRVSSKLGEGSTFTVVFYKDKLLQLKHENEQKQQELLKQSRNDDQTIQAHSLTAASYYAAEAASQAIAAKQNSLGVFDGIGIDGDAATDTDAATDADAATGTAPAPATAPKSDAKQDTTPAPTPTATAATAGSGDEDVANTKVAAGNTVGEDFDADDVDDEDDHDNKVSEANKP